MVIVKPGVWLATSSMVTMLAFRRVSSPRAVTAIGTFCIFCSRFWAVTMPVMTMTRAVMVQITTVPIANPPRNGPNQICITANMSSMIPERRKRRARVKKLPKVPIHDAAGRVVGLVGVSKDITERRKAEARLERALRIEPRNAALWYYMAKLRLHQGQYSQAAGLAAKSNSLDKGDRILQADNWRIIAHARYQNGDIAGAQRAQQKAAELAE